MMWCLSRALRETREHTKWLFGKREVQAEGTASTKAGGPVWLPARSRLWEGERRVAGGEVAEAIWRSG